MILRRLEDAIARSDNILGVIKALATNNSAHAVFITHPHSGAQQRLHKRVLRDANLEPETSTISRCMAREPLRVTRPRLIPSHKFLGRTARRTILFLLGL